MIPGLWLVLHLHLLLLLLVSQLEPMLLLLGLQPEGSTFDAGLWYIVYLNNLKACLRVAQ